MLPREKPLRVDDVMRMLSRAASMDRVEAPASDPAAD
jgi:hypothetical protein